MKLCIYRGLPGSGKTRAIKEWVDQLIDNNRVRNVIACSADKFFYDNRGEYNFNPYKIAQAHSECQIDAMQAMFNGVDIVIIDNTNTQKWEYAIYEEMAKIFDYVVEYKTIGGLSNEDCERYAKRNTHGVPLEAIKRMAERFEV